MFFIEQFSILLKIFYITGIKPVREGESILTYMFSLLPVLLSSIFGTAIGVYLIFFPHFNSHGTIAVIIIDGSILSSLLMILSANAQSLCCKHTYQSIINLTQQIEKKYKEKSSQSLPIQSIAFRCRLKVGFLFFLYFLSQGLVFAEVWLDNINNLGSSFLTSFMRATYPIQIVHFVLYMDSVVMFIHKLNDDIKDSPNFLHSSSKIEFLKYVKSMHMDLWKLVMLINNFFGWNLLFTVMYSFAYITLQLYWIFLTMHGTMDVLGVIEGSASLLYGTVGLAILVNSCKWCSLEIKDLIENIERFTFRTTDVNIYHLKHDILSQIGHFPMYISASDFFTIDRQLLTAIVGSYCMYMIIIIQFYQASVA